MSATYMPLPRAREIGALALFGETYGEDVRVVEIGGPWSRELCGGTHVQHSSQVGALTVTGESSVGPGVRRVEAFVGIDALRFLARERAIVAELSGLVGARPEELADRVGAMVTRLKDAERELERARKRAGAGGRRHPHRAGARRQRRHLPRPRRRGRRCRRRAHDGPRPARPARHRASRASSRSPVRPRADPSSSSRRTTRRAARHQGRRARARRGRAPSAAVAAARTTSPRAAGRTRRRWARPSRPSSGASGSSPADAGAGRPVGPEPTPCRGCGSGSTSGSVRVGVALSDPRGVLATPVETLARDGPDTARRPATPTSRPSPRSSLEHGAVGVVVGLPRSLSGDEGPAAARARTYAAVVAARIAPVWVRLVDERLTQRRRAPRTPGQRGRRKAAARRGRPGRGRAHPPDGPRHRRAAPAPLPGSRSDQDGASHGRRTRGRDPAARLHRHDLRWRGARGAAGPAAAASRHQRRRPPRTPPLDRPPRRGRPRRRRRLGRRRRPRAHGLRDVRRLRPGRGLRRPGRGRGHRHRSRPARPARTSRRRCATPVSSRPAPPTSRPPPATPRPPPPSSPAATSLLKEMRASDAFDTHQRPRQPGRHPHDDPRGALGQARSSRRCRSRPASRSRSTRRPPRTPRRSACPRRPTVASRAGCTRSPTSSPTSPPRSSS